jgi:hypothetical protein
MGQGKKSDGKSRQDAGAGLSAAAARMGKRGGMVRAQVLPPRLRVRIAKKGAEARWGKD